jgi:prevent-host-death family protein
MSGMQATTELDEISSVLDQITTDKDRVIVIREGKEVAALVPLEDLELLEELEDLLELEEIEASRKEAQEKGTIPLKDVKARLGL